MVMEDVVEMRLYVRMDSVSAENIVVTGNQIVRMVQMNHQIAVRYICVFTQSGSGADKNDFHILP